MTSHSSFVKLRVVDVVRLEKNRCKQQSLYSEDHAHWEQQLEEYSELRGGSPFECNRSCITLVIAQFCGSKPLGKIGRSDNELISRYFEDASFNLK